MAEKRRGLGRGIGALFPAEQEETRKRPIDIFFSNSEKKEPSGVSSGQESLSQLQISESSATVDKSKGKSVAETSIASTPEIVEPAERPDKGTIKTDSKDDRSATKRALKAKKLSAKTNPTEIQPGDDAQEVDNAVIHGSEVSDLDNNVSRETRDSVSRETLGTEGYSTEQIDTGDQQLQQIPGATFGELSLDEIIPNMQQPRQVFDEDDLAELSASIREVGVLQPIVVRPLARPLEESPEVRYELIMGERRWRASRLAGNTTIPAIVRHTDTGDMLRDALLENLHRAQLNALEEAAAYQQLMEDFQCTQEELSRRIARSRPQISNTLRLLKLPPLVQRRVAANVISAGHARALLGLSDPSAMERLAQRIVAENLSVRAVEELVAMDDGGDTPKKTARSRTSRYQPELTGLAVRLMDRFDTRVKVVMGQKKGRISIDFGSIDDLNRILEMINESSVDVSRETSGQ
ncbi:ParB/RepB/Spo0J family partition protein [Arcanobacterium phocisimile]|uniref:ParB/RepB/Spo0J family partition protein n=1 Tax=Arcanobacterium phocisimile TaxID=1302235 RepID=A0ABX7IGE0_9ACTO|nr:ParB/RepB/Spo0J family partition protein [Arcanobacterium phocisimile]QRV02179.1 ParB/RepB/Spo0J family partition protein [Arcanobacterium phocisimile]